MLTDQYNLEGTLFGGTKNLLEPVSKVRFLSHLWISDTLGQVPHHARLKLCLAELEVKSKITFCSLCIHQILKEGGILCYIFFGIYLI